MADQEGRLKVIHPEPEIIQGAPMQDDETVQEWISERTIRVRDEQVVRISEDSKHEPGFLEKAKRWLDERKEEFLHGSEERELIQVHEQRGAPLAAASVLREPVTDTTGPATTLSPADAAVGVTPLAPEAQPEPALKVMEAVEVAGDEQVVFREPQPTLSKEGMENDELRPELNGPVSEEEPTPAADPLQAREQAPPHDAATDWATLELDLDLNLGPAAESSGSELILDSVSQQTTQSTPTPAEVMDHVPAEVPEPQPSAPVASPSSESFEQAIAQIVASAYGRPVSRTVRGPGGEVVLEAGDTVTAETANRAKSLGVLRELLSAVQRD
ncbi:hypothetical protein [Deinococcus radiophilus]|uniref:hypothetical protein n=1 Tax=Deinococcus radiophilus TaxID=32062 RepID=UPI003609C2B0